MDPMNLSTKCAERVAFASSGGDGNDRWSELSVWHYPDPKMRKCWLVEAVGKSSLPGERDKVRRFNSASLERALSFFEPSDLARAVTLAATEYAEEQGLPMRSARRQPPTEPIAALAWLFGVEEQDVTLRGVGKALGVGESTMRQAIAAGRDIKVPLHALLPFVDLAAFQRSSVAAHVTREADHG